MVLLIFAALMYFLPAVIGRNKRDAAGIFVVNLLFGWTIIGWIIALIWACAAEERPHVLVVAGPGAGRYCSQCGTMSAFGSRFCGTCGRPI